MPDPREVIAAWEWTIDDAASLRWADEVIDALAVAGYHVCSEGQAVVDGEVVKLGRGTIDAYDSPFGRNFIEFYPDTAGDFFRIEEAPDAR